MVNIKDLLIKAGFTPAGSDVTMAASLEIAITDMDIAEKMMKLTDMLEDLDDVQNVYTNADIASNLLEKM